MRKIAIFLTILFSLCTLSLSALPLYALAEEPTTGVLADLAKDSSFRTSDYVAIEGDYSLQLLTLAESNEGDLIVYVYQPGAVAYPYRATYIRLCCGTSETVEPEDYRLALLDFEGVFFKYKVRGFSVPLSETRYYSVVQIMRPFVEGIDVPAEYGNTISLVPYKVAKDFRFESVAGNNSISVKEINVVEITDKFVGFVREGTGFKLNGDPYAGVDRYFVAFSTDWNIEQLFQIELSYLKQDVTFHLSDGEWVLNTDGGGGVGGRGSVPSERVDVVRDLDEYYDFRFDFLWKHVHFHWEYILSSEDFISSVETSTKIYQGLFIDVNHVDSLMEVSRSAIEDKDWVVTIDDFGFYSGLETSLLNNYPPFWTNVGEVTILRLSFASDGQAYNLGVVDNYQTGKVDSEGNPVPSNTSSFRVTDKNGNDLGSLEELIKRLAKIAGIVLAVVVVCALLGPVLPYILKGIWFVISAPFKLVAALFRKGKKKGK